MIRGRPFFILSRLGGDDETEGYNRWVLLRESLTQMLSYAGVMDLLDGLLVDFNMIRKLIQAEFKF